MIDQSNRTGIRKALEPFRSLSWAIQIGDCNSRQEESTMGRDRVWTLSCESVPRNEGNKESRCTVVCDNQIVDLAVDQENSKWASSEDHELECDGIRRI